MKFSFVEIALSLLCLTLLSSCGGGSNGDSQQTTVTNSILGEWHYIHPSSQCLEVNTFRDNGDFLGTALDEVYSGFYSFDDTVREGKRHKLKITLTEDNEQTDCKGRMTNGAGITRTVYAKFISEDKVIFFSKADGGTLIILFQRQPTS